MPPILEYTDNERIDRRQFPGVVNFDLTFAKLGAEALEQANLLVIELHRLLLMGFLEAQQAAELGKQIVTLSYVTTSPALTLMPYRALPFAIRSGPWLDW